MLIRTSREIGPEERSGRTRSPRAGFTLIELILAVTLTAMICSVLYAVIHSTMTTHARLSGYNEAALVADRIADMVARDLKTAYVADYDGDAVFTAESQQDLGLESDRVTLITCGPAWMPTLPSDTPGIEGFHEVTYAAIPSKSREGYLALYRREAPLDRKSKKGGRFALLHDQVEQFDLRFLGKEDEEVDWDKARDEWEYSPETGLPRIVMLHLTVSIGDAPESEEDRESDADRVVRFRRQEVHRIIAMPPDVSEDTSKLAALEPKNPRATPQAQGGGANPPGQTQPPGSVPGAGAPPGGVNPRGRLNPLQNLFPNTPPKPGSAGQGNPLLELLKRHQRGR
jgi:prepilin-type N-terminal cleavage/methylation domain-containing protein